MIYVFGNSLNHYDFHHSDVRTAWHIADGMRAAGEPAVVLWGGEDGDVDGVPHLHFDRVKLGADDTLFCVMPHIGEMAMGMGHLMSAGRKWIWPYAATDSRFNGAFDTIWVENRDWLDKFQELNPDSFVRWCMFGAPRTLPQPGESPYPGGRNVFYAGRVMSSQGEPPCTYRIAQLGLLIRHLPGDFKIWIASGSVSIPVACAGFDGYVPDKYRGCTLNARDGQSEPEQAEDGSWWMSPEDLKFTVQAGLNNLRVHFLGPMPYGTFWDYFHHADASVDYGFSCNAPGPNCKIMDPLRCGCKVVADGQSFSHYLIHKYDMGETVPYRQPYEMAQAIIRQVERPTSREHDAERFVDGEGWHVRAREMLG